MFLQSLRFAHWRKHDSTNNKNTIYHWFVMVSMAEDNIGGRPVDITKEGNEVKIVFHPIAKNATKPKANVFTVKMSKADLDKIKKSF